MYRRVVTARGQTFGRLVIQEIGPSEPNRKVRVLCTCGTTKWIAWQRVRTGKTRSCGCLRRELASKRARIHGESKTPEYNIWAGMHARCRYPDRPNYKNYGGRGICVCRRWHSYNNFIQDMGRRPPGASLERKYNHGNYSPSNCCWATRTQQARNTRTNRYLTYKGITLTLTDWAHCLGITTGALHWRLKRDWPLDDIFSPGAFTKRSRQAKRGTL